MLIRCLDVETTGLDPAIHRVCEAATVDLIVHARPSIEVDAGKTPNSERGRMWSSLVNPGMPIPPEASGIHDITDEMVKNAPTVKEIEAVLREVEQPDYYCAHNSRFDEKFIALDKPILDTYRIALWLWPSAPEHKLATLRYWLKLNLVDDMGPTFRGGRSHTAQWDAYVCAAVLRRAFMAGATVEQMVEVSNEPAILPRFTFGKHAMKKVEEVPSDYLDWMLRQDDMNEDVRHTAFVELQRRRNVERLKQDYPTGPVSTKYDGPQDPSIGD